MDDELIDFSCGEWQHLDPRAELIGGLPPIRWQSPPPTFIWATRALFSWKSFGEPNTGEMWYGPWTGTPPDVADNLDMLIKNTAIVRAVEKNLAQAKLPERTAASRRYQVIAKLSPQMAEHEGVHVAGVVLAAVGDHIGHRVRPCTEQHRAVGQLGIQADLSQELVADQASHDAGASHHLHVSERPHGVGDVGLEIIRQDDARRDRQWLNGVRSLIASAFAGTHDLSFSQNRFSWRGNRPIHNLTIWEIAERMQQKTHLSEVSGGSVINMDSRRTDRIQWRHWSRRGFDGHNAELDLAQTMLRPRSTCGLDAGYFRNQIKEGRGPSFTKPSPRRTFFTRELLDRWMASWRVVTK